MAGGRARRSRWSRRWVRLHAGQEALIRAAVEKADVVVVSIFVNPLAFGPNEFIANYPRSFEEDWSCAERAEVHVVFAPSKEEILPKGIPRRWSRK